MLYSFFVLLMATVYTPNPVFCSPISLSYVSHSVFAEAPTTICLANLANSYIPCCIQETAEAGWRNHFF